MNDNEIILDVFELKNYKPVLKYRIVVYDGIILSVNNSDIKYGVSKIINEVVKEELEILELTKIEKLDYGNSLTHKFQIRKLGWERLFLNLTEKDLIKLGFKEKPKSFWKKLIDFTVNDFWTWLERASILIGLIIIVVGLNLCHDNNPQKVEKKQMNISNHNTFQKSNQTDSLKNE